MDRILQLLVLRHWASRSEEKSSKGTSKFPKEVGRRTHWFCEKRGKRKLAGEELEDLLFSTETTCRVPGGGER